MRYHVLVADYDGTLAHHGVLEPATWDALCRFRASGRQLVIASGRILEELLELLPDPELFTQLVVENGALMYDPKAKARKELSPGIPRAFIDRLRERGVPLHAGHGIVGTVEPHEKVALEVIQELGLELQVIFNKGSVMILPSGVNKGTGVAKALRELGLSPHNAIAVGDAENDHALLRATECGVAVANALPALKETADLVLLQPHGLGIIELVERVLEDDLQSVPIARRAVTLGEVVLTGSLDASAEPPTVALDPYSTNALICGTTGSGKSTVTTGVIERFAAARYQFTILDPEGDYQGMPDAVVLGAPERAPIVDEVLDVLKHPRRNVIVNLLGVPLAQRPEKAMEMFAAIAELRARTGRPHWLVVDEAHQLLPADRPSAQELPRRRHGTLYITARPADLDHAVLASINTLLVVGDQPAELVRELCGARGLPLPNLSCVEDVDRLPLGHALCWRIGAPFAVVVQVAPTQTERLPRASTARTATSTTTSFAPTRS